MTKTRLEFRSDASEKFWSVRVDGQAVTTSWGRLGTSGQAKTKDFPTHEAAVAEARKKTAEKVKKGYVEVDIAEAAATTTIEPAPPYAEPVPEQPLSPGGITPEARAKYAELPRHDRPIAEGRVHTPDLKESATKGRTFIEEWWAEHEEDIRDIAARSPLDAEVLKIALADPFDASAGAMEVRAKAAAVRLRLCTINRSNEGAAIDYWLVKGGAAFALLGAEECLWLRGEGTAPNQHTQTIYGANTKVTRAQEPFNSRDRRLRVRLATTSDADYAAARKAAETLRGLHLGTRVRMSYLFPTETQWLDECIDLCATSGQSFWHDPLLFCATTEDQLEQILGRLGGDGRAQVDHLMGVFGADLAPWLGAWLAGQSTPSSPPPPTRGKPRKLQEALLDALLAIETDAAFAALVPLCDLPKMFLIVTQAAMDRPHRAIRVLSSLVTTSRRKSYAKLLRAVVLDHPGAVAAVWPDLGDDARAAVLALQAPAVPLLPHAPADRLPPALVTPGWGGPDPVAAPVLAGVSQLRPTPISEQARVALAGPTDAELAEFAWALPLFSDPQMRSEEHQARARFFERAPLSMIHYVTKEMTAARFRRYPLSRWAGDMTSRFWEDALPTFQAFPRMTPSHAMGPIRSLPVSEVAPIVAAALQTKGRRDDAEAWLAQNAEIAAYGLIPAAVGKHGRARRFAEDALRVVHGAQPETLAAAAIAHGPKVEAVVQAMLATKIETQTVKRLPKLPSFVRLDRLPQVLLANRQHALDAPATELLLAMFALSEPSAPYEELEGTLALLDRESVNSFFVALFDEWQVQGLPGKSIWILGAFSFVGTDETVRLLVPLIRSWPAASGHKRAAVGLEVLGGIGSDLALLHLFGISRKIRFKTLKQRAGELVEQIAAARGLTELELGDRLVPDLDLDEDGSMSLDYGARSFIVGFDEALKPFVRDESGKVRAALPKPAKSDDTELAQAARKAFNALKKDARAVARDQIDRLEQAMVDQRRWSGADFTRFFVHHPLLTHVVRRLVWAVYGDGELVDTFRVAEDRSFADSDDGPFDLPEQAIVGIPHRLLIDDAVLARWGEVLSDYELLQPFEQIGRPTFLLVNESLQSALDRFAGVPIKGGDFLQLREAGWKCDFPVGQGQALSMFRDLPDGRELHIHVVEGINVAALGSSPDQAIDSVELRYKRGTLVEAAELDELATSELLRELNALLR